MKPHLITYSLRYMSQFKACSRLRHVYFTNSLIKHSLLNKTGYGLTYELVAMIKMKRPSSAIHLRFFLSLPHLL